MEPYTLDFYHFTHLLDAIKYLYKHIGWLIIIFIIPITKFNALYIYAWWKLILLHIVNIISFYLSFNQNALASDIAIYITGFDIPYVIYIVSLVILYLYSSLSIIFMYFNSLIYERYELFENFKFISKLIIVHFKLAYKIGGFLYKILLAPPSSKSSNKSNQKIQSSQTLTQTITPKVVTKVNTTSTKISKQTPTNKPSLAKNTSEKSIQESKESTQKVYTENNYAYSLGKQLAFGGEGKIHVISSTLLAKIFYKGMATHEKKEKLIKLLSMRKMSSVVFPQKLLYDANKNFIGYTMNQIYNTKELGVLHISENRKKYFPHWTYIDLLDLSITIANTLKRLHDKKIIVADFNPRNVLVKESKKIYFIDIDSYQVNRQASTVGMMMYTRPIHLNNSHKEYLKNKSDDIYALSVIIFQTLTSGGNPYAMKSNMSEDELVKRHEFSFNANEPYESNVSDKLIDAWANLSGSLRDYFEEVFRFQNPASLSKLTKALEGHKQNLMRAQTKTRRQTT